MLQNQPINLITITILITARLPDYFNSFSLGQGTVEVFTVWAWNDDYPKLENSFFQSKSYFCCFYDSTAAGFGLFSVYAFFS